MIGEHIVDFCCNEKKSIIEVDGGQHNEAHNLLRDKKRDEYFNKYGYAVLRFWNNEIDENIEGVLEKIRTILLRGSSTSPSPSPGLERG
jgi:very-short-patch-repair endonuclease